ncbi:MAG TPA: hypothetical protein VER98_14625 [Terriglobia bacterium]|nr:hypothetical protein [Terriglobia bacterium]
MKTFVYICGICCVFLTSASAQVTTPRWNGYVFFAPGTSTNVFYKELATIHIGGGAEGFIYKGLGAGAEIGPVIAWSAPGGYAISPPFDRVHGLGSANIAYHFLPRTTDRKLEPFLTAGYSLFFGIGNSLEIPGRGSTHTQSGYNVGGGVNFWLQKKAALRFEVRHQSSIWYKSMDVRMGVTFR